MKSGVSPGAALIASIYRGIAADHLDWIGDVVEQIAGLIDAATEHADEAKIAEAAGKIAQTITAGVLESAAHIRLRRARRGAR